MDRAIRLILPALPIGVLIGLAFLWSTLFQ